MTKLPQRLDGESPERSAIRAVRFSGAGMSLWLSELCSRPATGVGTDRARLNARGLYLPRRPECPPHVDRRHLSSPDSSSHHASRNHVLTGQRAGAAACVPDMKKAPVPGGAEAGGVPPVGLEPTTFGLKVRRPVVVWLEHTDVLIRSWLARCAAIASNSTIAGNAGNSSSKGVLR